VAVRKRRRLFFLAGRGFHAGRERYRRPEKDAAPRWSAAFYSCIGPQESHNAGRHGRFRSSIRGGNSTYLKYNIPEKRIQIFRQFSPASFHRGVTPDTSDSSYSYTYAAKRSLYSESLFVSSTRTRTISSANKHGGVYDGGRDTGPFHIPANDGSARGAWNAPYKLTEARPMVSIFIVSTAQCRAQPVACLAICLLPTRRGCVLSIGSFVL
jgi:hypothetical protein